MPALLGRLAAGEAAGREQPKMKRHATAPAGRYAVCLQGTKCRNRNEDHLDRFVHPFDPDYEPTCEKCNVAQEDREEPSLKGLFRWLDFDGNGKLSPDEIQHGLKLLSALTGEPIPSVEHLDEDGNGAVSFSEFAAWAGPRLHLPLGVKLNRQATSSATKPCGIRGCPCTDYHSAKRANRKKGLIAFLLSGQRGSGESTTTCTCGHKKSAHMPVEVTGAPCVFPTYWSHQNQASGFNELVPVPRDVLQGLQRLFDATYRNIYTRDRQKHQDSKAVPRGFQVVGALRNEHCRSWLHYNIRRSSMLEEIQESPIDKFRGVRSDAWQDLCPAGAESLSKECNEWYLFHGCSDRVARHICSTDFHIGSAGKNTGTLYGGGTYFSESITKVDEYAKRNHNGQYCVLLCRCLGGRVLYNDEVTPDAEELTKKCIQGPYDCVLGDREKCRGTYREFVFYDSDDMYPEYIIYYNRL